jgi:hypothetical protein
MLATSKVIVSFNSVKDRNYLYTEACLEGRTPRAGGVTRAAYATARGHYAAGLAGVR